MNGLFHKPLLVLLLLCTCSAFQLSSSRRLPLKVNTLNCPLTQARCHSLSFLRLSVTDDNASVDSLKEELLMNISCKVQPEHSKQDVLDSLQSYLVSFPFAALLPVQPLTWEPRSNNSGLTLKFLRKPTKEKNSVDGGITFSISCFEYQEDHNEDSIGDNKDESNHRIEVKAVRNSNGQTISKVFSEGILIKAFVKGLCGETGGRQGLGYNKLMEMISVQSIYHRWM